MNQGTRHRLRAAAANRMRAFRLDEDARVLVCVSGGADSVCLVRVLCELGVPLGVFHMNHGTRGDASTRDAHFVRDLAASLGVPFHMAVRDIPSEAAASGKSLEETGRDARYEEAAAVAAAEGYGAIATAHHADDQAETVLMRLIRGTGLKGLGGIPPARYGRPPESPPLKGDTGGCPPKSEDQTPREDLQASHTSPAASRHPLQRGTQSGAPSEGGGRTDARPGDTGAPAASAQESPPSKGDTGGCPPETEGGEIIIIRPLIDCTRADIEVTLEELGQDYCRDATNDSDAHLRNRIRHELLPLLRARCNPAIDDALARLAESARADDALLDRYARDFFATCRMADGSVDRAAFMAGDVALQRRAAGLLLAAWGIEPAFERAEAVRALIAEGETGAAYEVDGLKFYNNRAVTEALRDEPPPPPTVPLAIPGETRIHQRVYRVRFRKPGDIGDPRAYCSAARQVFDADAFLGDAAVRGREEGDRFRPLGLEGEKKLKDWFIDRGLTRMERATQHLITVDGRILWVVGHAIDARAAVTAATRRVVEIEVLE